MSRKYKFIDQLSLYFIRLVLDSYPAPTFLGFYPKTYKIVLQQNQKVLCLENTSL
jgi:hypothetical protein